MSWPRCISRCTTRRYATKLATATIVAVCALAVCPVRAAPPAEQSEAATALAPAQAVERAANAWQRGDWTRVRELLVGPLADPDGFDDPASLREARVLYADAVLQAPGLEPGEVPEEAAEVIDQLLESEPDWSPPPAVYAPAFYEAVELVRQRREQAQAALAAENCRVERASCVADRARLSTEATQLKLDYDELKLRYDAQEVEVLETTKRSRGLALLPLGLGHFFNDKPALGITFATTEVAFGAIGLSLLLTRNVKYQCSRPNGGLGGDSLTCRPPDGKATFSDADELELKRIRNAEQTFGWLLLGAVVTDIVLSQILFEPESTETKGRVPRSELERTDEDDDGKARPRRDRRSAKMKWRPTGGASPRGATLGVRLDF